MVLSPASDIHTRQTIWVARRINGDQLNSHTGRSLDGFSAANWAGICTNPDNWKLYFEE